MVLTFAGEFIFVDSFVKLLPKIGLSEVTGVIAKNWSESLGESLKRIIRSVVVLIST